MNDTKWTALLADISREVLSDNEFVTGGEKNLVTDEQRQRQWLGQPGATEVELQQLEQRLGRPLPASYRALLATSNGFGPLGCFVYDLYSASAVDWLSRKEPELVAMWEADPTPTDYPGLADDPYLRYDLLRVEGVLRPGHLRQCLMISGWGDAGFLALNPAVQHAGEWEAWHFANWYPGAVRFRSLPELMASGLETYRKIKRGQL